MKAIAFEQFGPSTVLKEAEVPLRALRSGEVQLRIRFASVNPVDWKIREGYLDFLPHQFPIVPGWDAAGEVVAVAEDVEGWQVGDLVMAYTRLPKVHAGTYAEFINLPASYLARVPVGVDLAEAASLPLVGLTAFQALHDVLKIKTGDKVLITAGAGGVGSLAIQLAKAAGAEVTATARENNHAYLRELGAEHAVDYTASDSTKRLQSIAPQGFDLVFDGAGGTSLEEAWQVLAEQGRLVSIVETPDAAKAGRPDVSAFYHFVEPSGAQLSRLASLIEQGKVRIPAIAVRNVKAAAAAQDENQSRRVQGKLVLEIAF